MSYSPIAGIIPQYEDQSTWYLKFYLPTTTTPFSMSIDAAGTTLLAKAQLNINGFPTTDGTTLFIPHVNHSYDLWLFPTAAEADSNDTTNAFRMASNNIRSISDISQAYEFKTLAEAVAFTGAVDGKVAHLAERTTNNGGGAVWDYVLANTVTVNTHNIVACTGDATLALVLRVGDSVNIKQFGVTGDGATDDFASLKGAFDYANTTGKKVIGSHDMTIVLLGSTDIDVTTDVDFLGANIDIENWGGKFSIINSVWTNYVAGSAVYDNIFNTGTLTGDTLTGWDGLTEVLGSFFRLNSSAYFYTYRNATVTQQEMNIHVRGGKCNSLFYSFDSALLTSVDVLKLPDKPVTFKNTVFMVGSRDVGVSAIFVNNCGFIDIKRVKFVKDDYIPAATNMVWIDMHNSAFVVVDGVYFDGANKSSFGSGYTYNIGMSGCYDVTYRNLKGYGDGWGVTGNNHSYRVKHYDCELNRIDFHRPFRDYMIVRDCVIGSSGIKVSAIGDLTVEDSKFIHNGTDTYKQDSYISSRDDTGGFCIGALNVRNCEFVSVDKQYIRLLSHKSDGTGGISLPSVLDFVFWDKIVFEKCDFGFDSVTDMMPTVNGGVGMTYPYDLTFSGCEGDLSFYRVLTTSNPRYPLVGDETVYPPQMPNLLVAINNCVVGDSPAIRIIDQSVGNFKIKLDVTNVKSARAIAGSGVAFGVRSSGEINISHSAIESLDFIEGVVNIRPLAINVSNSNWFFSQRHNANPLNGLTTADKTTVVISNSTIDGATADVPLFAAARLSGCKTGRGSAFTDKEGVMAVTNDHNTSVAAAAVVNLTAVTDIEKYNDYSIVLGTGAALEVYKVDLSYINSSSHYVAVSSTSGFTVKRTTATNIEITNNGTAAIYLRWIQVEY